MNEELKPCPFCGAHSDAVRAFPRTCNKDTPYDARDRAYPIVRCLGCGASQEGADWTGIETAITKWNYRPTPAPAVAAEHDLIAAINRGGSGEYTPPAAVAVPKEWVSEIVGGEFDEMTAGQGFRRGWNECRAKMLALIATATAPTPAPVASEAVAQGYWQATDGGPNPNYQPDAVEAMTQGGGVDVEKVMALVGEYGYARWEQGDNFAREGCRPASDECRIEAEAIRDRLRALLASAPAVPVGDGWIAVGDRLPEFGDDVLVRCRRRNGAIEHTTMVAGLFDPHRDPKRPVWMDTVTEASIPDRWEVTRWQPLPPASSVDGEG